MFKNFFAGVTAFALASLFDQAQADHYFDSNGKLHLRASSDGHFKIMQLTDLHFGENSDRDAQTANAIKDWAAKEQPDLITITGNLISGFYWDQQEHVEEFWQHYHDRFAQLMDDIAIPWAMIPGDHDFEADADQEKMLYLESLQNMSLSRPNSYKYFGVPIFHRFTYVMHIEDSRNADTTVGRVFMFGTGRNGCLGRPGKDCIRRDQVEWFRAVTRRIEKDDPYRANGLAFMHHPLQEHMNLVNSYPVHGQKRDWSGCQAINTGLYSEFKQSGTVKWVSAGSDHSSDYWGNYGGINLAYGRKSGFNSYGPKFALRGARIFDLEISSLTGAMAVDTWIRQEDGSQDFQEDFSMPTQFSWLRSSYCYGSEHLSTSQWKAFLEDPLSPFNTNSVQ